MNILFLFFLTYFTNHNLKRTEKKKRLVVKTILLTKINKKYIDTKKIIFIKKKLKMT